MNQMTRRQWLKLGTGSIAVAVLAARFLWAWSMIGEAESDFSIYLGAARHLADGSTPWTQAGYLYPPLTAILVLPLSGLGYVAARKAWFLLMVAALVATAMILGRVIGTSRGGVAVGLVFLAVMGLLEENLVLGQPNPLILFLLVVSLWAAQRQKPTGEGLGIGVAAALKLWPAALAIVPLVNRRYRTVVAAGLAFVAAGIIPTLLARQLSGPQLPPKVDFVAGTPSFLNHSAAGLGLRLAIPPTPSEKLPVVWVAAGGAPAHLELPEGARVYSLVATTLAVLWAGSWFFWALARRIDTPGANLLIVAMVLTGALITVPICWPHYLLMHAVTLAALWSNLDRRSWPFIAGGLTLTLLATWSSRHLVGGYVDAFDFTAARPILLWAVTSAALVFQTALLPVLAVLIRRTTGSSAD
jgi:hypothetical protein